MILLRIYSVPDTRILLIFKNMDSEILEVVVEAVLERV